MDSEILLETEDTSPVPSSVPIKSAKTEQAHWQSPSESTCNSDQILKDIEEYQSVTDKNGCIIFELIKEERSIKPPVTLCTASSRERRLVTISQIERTDYFIVKFFSNLFIKLFVKPMHLKLRTLYNNTTIYKTKTLKKSYKINE